MRKVKTYPHPTYPELRRGWRWKGVFLISCPLGRVRWTSNVFVRVVGRSWRRGFGFSHEWQKRVRLLGRLRRTPIDGSPLTDVPNPNDFRSTVYNKRRPGTDSVGPTLQFLPTPSGCEPGGSASVVILRRNRPSRNRLSSKTLLSLQNINEIAYVIGNQSVTQKFYINDTEALP